MVDQPSGDLIGPVAVSSREGVGDAVRQFREAVAKAGGNFGKIDAVSTTFAVEYSDPRANCTANMSMIECKGKKRITPETHIEGRAFKSAGTTATP